MFSIFVDGGNCARTVLSSYWFRSLVEPWAAWNAHVTDEDVFFLEFQVSDLYENIKAHSTKRGGGVNVDQNDVISAVLARPLYCDEALTGAIPGHSLELELELELRA